MFRNRDDENKCPQCGRQNTLKEYHLVLEPYHHCIVCGFAIWAENPGSKSVIGDTVVIDFTKEPQGYGALQIEHKDYSVENYSYQEPLTDSDIEDCKQRLSDPDVDPRYSYLSRWNEEKEDVEMVFGELGQAPVFENVPVMQLESPQTLINE